MMLRIFSTLAAGFFVLAVVGCDGVETEPAPSSAEPALGKADSGDQFFNGYFVPHDGELSERFVYEQGEEFTLKFTAPRDYPFEGGIVAYLIDTETNRIPYGTAYDVDCGATDGYYIVRETAAFIMRADEPFCTVTTAHLYPGIFKIRWEFSELTYEGDWDWYSTRVLETGSSNTFSVR